MYCNYFIIFIIFINFIYKITFFVYIAIYFFII